MPIGTTSGSSCWSMASQNYRWQPVGKGKGRGVTKPKLKKGRKR